MEQQEYKKIISGQKKGIAAVFLRAIFAVLSVVYGAVIGLRNFFYSAGVFKSQKVQAFVISIGNITAGGTGKTPLVIWLCNFLKQKGIRAAVLTRGYKTEDRRQRTEDRVQIDEPAEIAEGCSDVPVIINADRFGGAREAIEKHNAKVLILDDGFQHRRLFRNLDIVAIDATVPFGFGKLLPAGLLREPVASIKRANTVVITRSDLVGESELEEIEETISRINPNILIVKTIHKPSFLGTVQNEQLPAGFVIGKNVFAFCGIGNPESFITTLKNAGAIVSGYEIFDDHYKYADVDIRQISEKAKEMGAGLLITTKKDWTKIQNLKITTNLDMPMAYLGIEIKITDGEDKFARLITETISDKI